MRSAVAVVVAVLAGCGTYDPVDQITHREYSDTGAAIRAILAEAGNSQVYAIGEYHATAPIRGRSPMTQFSDDILGRLSPWADDLVVEAWFDASCATGVDEKLANRPATTDDLTQIGHDVLPRLPTHGLPTTCIEHGSVLDAKGRVDFYRLLAMVTDKLRENTERLVAQGRSVIVYGGALHNDLYPRWPLDELSYATSLAKKTSVLEIDLVQPEVVAPMKILWQEPWYQLLSKSSPERVMVWERGPNSYVVILPAHSEQVAQRMRI